MKNLPSHLILKSQNLYHFPRCNATELLDQPIGDLSALRDNLRDLEQLDRYLGGWRLTWQALLPLLRTMPKGACATLLDVATGGAHEPRRLAALAHRQGYRLRPIASDRLGPVLRIARDMGGTLPLIQHDALHIPISDGGVDFVTCSLALHHFAPHEAVALLCEMYRVARRAVIINDLRRSQLAYLGARVLAYGPWHAMAQHDGPLSVLRAYTIPEVRVLLNQAGLSSAVVAARPLFRLIIVLEK